MKKRYAASLLFFIVPSFLSEQSTGKPHYSYLKEFSLADTSQVKLTGPAR